MELNHPVSTPAIIAGGTPETSFVSGIRDLPDHPPGEWVERMFAKYGEMAISENARTVLERRYLKKIGRAHV